MNIIENKNRDRFKKAHKFTNKINGLIQIKKILSDDYNRTKSVWPEHFNQWANWTDASSGVGVKF